MANVEVKFTQLAMSGRNLIGLGPDGTLWICDLDAAESRATFVRPQWRWIESPWDAKDMDAEVPGA